MRLNLSVPAVLGSGTITSSTALMQLLYLPTLDDMLQGPSAFVFCGDDVAAAAKAVKEIAGDAILGKIQLCHICVPLLSFDPYITLCRRCSAIYGTDTA